jgi:Holliday junction DNA helicase RuvA
MLIERIRGEYAANVANGIVVDVQGVGYGVELPLSTLCSLPPIGSQITLWTYTYVREDAMRLFGFSRYEDRLAFEIMLGLSGVGPKVALAILSTLSVSAIRHAITSSQPQILEQVPGVGKRLAEKILVELRPKLLKLQSVQDLGLQDEPTRLDAKDFASFDEEDQGVVDRRDVVFDDVRSALENLGFKDKLIQPLLKTLRGQYAPEQEFQDVMREALRLLHQQNHEKAGAAKSKDKATPPKEGKESYIDQELF